MYDIDKFDKYNANKRIYTINGITKGNVLKEA